MPKHIFPKNFWWGGASSGCQSEGFHNKAHLNLMDFWFKQSPQDFFDGVGPFEASEFYTHYEDDLKMMREIGMNSFRTSIQWARLIDDLDSASYNKEARAYYDKLIDAMHKNNIEPIINLYHFDMPIEIFQKHNGWISRESVELFVKYAKTAFELFGDKVKYWCVVNEPVVQPEAGYLYGFHYPKFIGHGIDAVQVTYHMNLATAKVIEAFKQSRAGKNGGKICTVLNLTPTYPATDSLADKKAADFSDDFFNNIYVDSAVKGQLTPSLVEVLQRDKVLWKAQDGDAQIFKNNTVDFLGINYYQPRRVQSRKNPLPQNFSKEWMPDIYFEDYIWKDRRMNPYRGWEIHPETIYKIAMNMKNNYPNMPWFISENGMGVEGEAKFINKDGEICDDYRIEFYEEHLGWLHKAIQEGSNCFGFHAWTPFDCWSWNNAYKNRYGYIAVDLATQKRTIKKSGYWLKEVSKNNGF